MKLPKKIIILTAIPVLIVGIYISLFGLNIPFLDQWRVLPLLVKKQQGLLSFADLFAQHNEHRPFFPRLLWITLAGFTQYNVNAELWLNFIIAIGTFVFFARQTIKMWRKLEIDTPWHLLPLMALIVFNLGQRESWLQGFQTVMFLGMASIVIGIFSLAKNPGTWLDFTVALALGVIANYSMANGVLYWPIGFVILFICAHEKTRLIRILLWLTCGMICACSFFVGWTGTSHLDIVYVLYHLWEWGVWILNFLGAPAMTLWYVAWIFGMISLALYILIIGRLFRMRQLTLAIPYLAIAFFILITAVVISLGRIKGGMPQSVVPRYLTMSVWYWTSLLVLFPLLNLKPFHQRFLYALLTTSLIFLMIGGGWRGYVSIHQRILPAYRAVEANQIPSDADLARISPNVKTARSQIMILCENKWSVCSNRK